MITLLTGENTYEADQALYRIISAFDGEVERIDASELTIAQLPDIFMGQTLFSANRLVVLVYPSENKELWKVLPTWLQNLSDTTHIVLVEPHPDRRTATYKWLQKNVTIESFSAWSEHDTQKAAQWVGSEMQQRGGTIDNDSARLVVARAGVDQWQLHHAVEKLLLLEAVTPEAVEQIIDSSVTESAFDLFETALRGDQQEVVRILRSLELTEDAYRVFGLLTSQVVQIAALSTTDKSSRDVASEIGAHPFALQKLAPYANVLSRSDVQQLLADFAKADKRLKTTDAAPWLLIEQTLLSVPTAK